MAIKLTKNTALSGQFQNLIEKSSKEATSLPQKHIYIVHVYTTAHFADLIQALQ